MLVQFMLKNVLSFKEEMILDMTAINAYKEHEYNLIDIGTKEKFLRVAAVYGANASGKSNLYIGMGLFQKIIAESFNNVDNTNQTSLEKYYIPFLFDGREDNSEFQIIMILGEFEYKYGFEYNESRIESEWLYRKNIKTNRTVMLLERLQNEVRLGAAVRKSCDAYKGQIPPETLALSFFNKLRVETDIFRDVYNGIMDTLVVSTNIYEDERSLKRFLPEVIDNDKEKLLDFLKAIDSGIQDIDYLTNEKEPVFFTVHKGKNGEDYKLGLFLESEGTLKSIMVFIDARFAILNNKSLFIDELNVKLHPLLLKFIIDLFYNKNSTAQLIYTTHDTTLLDKKFFRRDQIWFVQKDEYGCSELTALSDFKVRSDASFEKDYLAGVYGGIPLIKEFDMKEGE